MEWRQILCHDIIGLPIKTEMDYFRTDVGACNNYLIPFLEYGFLFKLSLLDMMPEIQNVGNV